MKVKNLKMLMDGVDDEMEVLIPSSTTFNGLLLSPCENESGVSQVPTTDDELNPQERDVFILAPHGYTNVEQEEKAVQN